MTGRAFADVFALTRRPVSGTPCGDVPDGRPYLARQDGDLLVIGTGRRGALRRLLGCRVNRSWLPNAHCPVLAIPPPALAQQAGYGLRGCPAGGISGRR